MIISIKTFKKTHLTKKDRPEVSDRSGWWCLLAAVLAVGSAALDSGRLLGGLGTVAVFTIRLFHCIYLLRL